MRNNLKDLMVALRFGSAGLCLLALGGCAGSAPVTQVGDPLESVNRVSHGFNKGLDTVVVRPVSQAYDFITPALVKHLLGNAASHVDLPRTAINLALQGDLQGTVETVGRFAINTLVGAGGVLDPATEFGLPKRDEDFGQTLAVWGAPAVAYVELPVLGPRTARGVVGMAVDTVLNPMTYLTSFVDVPSATTYAPRAYRVVEFRTQYFDAIDQALYGDGDSYVITRSVYLQNRQRAITNGRGAADALPDIYGDDQEAF